MLDSKKTRICNHYLGSTFSTDDTLITSGKKVSWPDSVLICSHRFLCEFFFFSFCFYYVAVKINKKMEKVNKKLLMKTLHHLNVSNNSRLWYFLFEKYAAFQLDCRYHRTCTLSLVKCPLSENSYP